MNTLNIIVQSKDDPKNLLSSKQKADALPEGLTVVFIEAGTKGGQLGIELIIKGKDIYGNSTIMGCGLTENNMEGLMGGFIGVRMRFGRMPQDQWELVRHYVKDQVMRFMNTLEPEKRAQVEQQMRKFFNC
jgi:hypothetical protein